MESNIEKVKEIANNIYPTILEHLNPAEQRDLLLLLKGELTANYECKLKEAIVNTELVQEQLNIFLNN